MGSITQIRPLVPCALFAEYATVGEIAHQPLHHEMFDLVIGGCHLIKVAFGFNRNGGKGFKMRQR